MLTAYDVAREILYAWGTDEDFLHHIYTTFVKAFHKVSQVVRTSDCDLLARWRNLILPIIQRIAVQYSSCALKGSWCWSKTERKCFDYGRIDLVQTRMN